jgi:hypothetical protein
MAPRSSKVAAKAASKGSSKATADDQARQSSRVRKPASKTQLNARFESGSGASSWQSSRNNSRRRARSSPPRSVSPEEDLDQEDDEEDTDEALVEDEAAVIRRRAKAVGVEIKKRKQIVDARADLAAQELLLRSLPVNDTRTSVPYAPVVDVQASAAAATPLEERSSFLGAISNFGVVATMFSTIPRRYFDDIFHSRLEVKNIIRFISDYSSMAVSEKIEASDAKNMLDLIRSFDMYAYIVYSFTSHASVKAELIRVITLYRLRLISMAGYKTFASIRAYYEEFLARIIRLGQDNPIYWTSPFPEAEWRLVDVIKKAYEPSSSALSRKTYPAAGASKDPVTPAPGERWTISNGACRAWAMNGECTSRNCKYRHMCIPCQENYNPQRCPKNR